MLLSVYVVNANNTRLPLHDVGTSPFYIKEISGLNPPDASINTSKTRYKEGSYYSSHRVEERTITIDIGLSFNSKYGYDMGAIRDVLYSVFPVGQKRTLKFVQNTKEDLYISGYVESIDTDMFTEKPR